jgi:hypothetical protein
MAQIENPRKQFNFQVFIPGLNPFLAQKVTKPDFSIDQVEHGDVNYKVKTGGLPNVGNLVIDKISSATSPDSWVFQWMKTVQNMLLGGGALPSLYKRTLVVEEYSTDGVTLLNRETYRGCWPCKRNGVELNRMGSENTLESIEFSVDIPDQQ